MIHFARICFVLLLSNQVLGQYVSDCDNQPLDLTEAKSAIAAAQNVYSQYKSYINNIHQEEEKVKTEFNSYAVGFRKAFDTFNSNAKVKQCVVLAELKSSYDSNVDYAVSFVWTRCTRWTNNYQVADLLDDLLLRLADFEKEGVTCLGRVENLINDAKNTETAANDLFKEISKCKDIARNLIKQNLEKN
uniref:Protein TsetseEP domain-containing protein n=1 Tax=Clastoptera arizonana TaxID=38151 RepID=A0A1B6E162_9HEMI